MRFVRSTVGLAALAAGLVVGSGVALAAGDAAKGKQAYMKYGCWQCHGTVGQGSPITGPKLAPDPMPYEALVTFLRTSRRTMPPYKAEVLPNADIEDIHAFLTSVPRPVDYKTIPLLND